MRTKLVVFRRRMSCVVTVAVAWSFCLPAPAEFTDANWTTMGSGMNGSVFALAASGSNVYAAGSFSIAGGIMASNIAKWDGSSWSALGSGLNGPVYALAVLGSNVYAGGYFTTAGGISASNLAKWNGISWSALGMGLSTPNSDYSLVNALAASGDELYVGGRFLTAGGSPATNIAKWNGSDWSPLGEWMTEVLSLASFDGGLYAGDRTGVFKWDGNRWSNLGIMQGIYFFGAEVRALALSGSNVYAGGWFSSVNWVPDTRTIAKWDGTNWSALGSGIESGWYVYALAASGTEVYAGGSFEIAGGVPARSIAKWNGSTWFALGSGVSLPHDYGRVAALSVSGNDLFVGGNFLTAGGKPAAYIARGFMPTLPILSITQSNSTIRLSWSSTNMSEFVLEQADILTQPTIWIPNSTGTSDDETNKSVTLPASENRRFFRLRRP